MNTIILNHESQSLNVQYNYIFPLNHVEGLLTNQVALNEGPLYVIVMCFSVM